MNKLPILRSGFISLSTKGLEKPNAPDRHVYAAILSKQRTELTNDYFYHRGIQELFKQALNGGQFKILDDFDTREKILLNAKEAFGTNNFRDWISAQANSIHFNGSHEAFVLETLEYLIGNKRKMHVQQWVRLLEANNETPKDILATNNYIKKVNHFFRDNSDLNRLDNVLLKWVQQKDHFYDLLCSLVVIFGNRRLFNDKR